MYLFLSLNQYAYDYLSLRIGALLNSNVFYLIGFVLGHHEVARLDKLESQALRHEFDLINRVGVKRHDMNCVRHDSRRNSLRVLCEMRYTGYIESTWIDIETTKIVTPVWHCW